MFKSLIGFASDDHEPKYYICARRDNGFIAAYRAYFFIKGSTIRKVSGFRYEHSVIFGKKADGYKAFSPGYYVFNIKAKDRDPSGWTIEQNKYDRDLYSIDALVTLLKKAEITLSGYIQLVLNEFDGYQLIYMSSTDQEGHGLHLGDQSLFYRDGNLIKIGKKINFGSVRDFYRCES